MHRDTIQIKKIRNVKGDTITETEEIQKIQKSILNTTGESGRNGQFPKQIPIPTLNQDQLDQLNSPNSLKEIEGVIESLPTKQVWDQMVLVENSTRPSKKPNANTLQTIPQN